MDILAYLLAMRNNPLELARTAGMCALSVVFCMSLGHYTGRRIEAWRLFIKQQVDIHKRPENELPSFAAWLYRRKLGGLLITINDAGLAAAPIYVIVQFTRLVLWPLAPGFMLFVILGITSGLISNWVGIKYADW